MAKNQLSFFATKADVESLLRAVESKRQLQFVLTGLFDSPNVEKMQSLLAARNLGHMDVGDANQRAGYLVASREISIEVRPVPQQRGGVKYAVDQLANPTTIAFRPGGSFGERCLIAGEVGTTSDNPNSLELFQAFSKEVRHQFAKIKPFYVGKEAGELLDKGWRLTTNAKSPTLYDLKRD
jgi:ATP phosphoribosyltransferase regulatory subunit HisZ